MLPTRCHLHVQGPPRVRYDMNGPVRGAQERTGRPRPRNLSALLRLVIAGLLAMLVACSGSRGGSAAVSASGSASPAPSATPSVILLVHGFADNRQGYSCTDYWGQAEKAFRQWDPSIQVVTVGFISGDHDCGMTIGSGSPNTPIEAIGRELATDVYQTYSSKGIPVALVGHSMGGLVVRSAVAQAGSTGGPPFLLVPRAVTIDSPHGGTDALRGCPLTQCDEMHFGSTFLQQLEQDPQGRGGTVWTLFGSDGDHLVTPASAMGMQAAYRFLYERPSYGHGPIHHDASNATDARWWEITGASRVPQTDEPHSLRAIFLAATTGIPGSIRAGSGTASPAGLTPSLVSSTPPKHSGLTTRSAVCLYANEALRATAADIHTRAIMKRVSTTKDDVQAFIEAIAPSSGQMPAQNGPDMKRTEELISDGMRVATRGASFLNSGRDFKDFSQAVATLSTHIASFCGSP